MDFSSSYIVGKLSMSQSSVIQIAGQAIYLAFELAGPVLGAALAVGLLVSLFQTLTQIQEATLSFLPKLAAIALVLFVTGHWMIGQLITFTTTLYGEIPKLLGGG